MKYEGRLQVLNDDEIQESGIITRTEDTTRLDKTKKLALISMEGMEDHEPKAIWGIGLERMIEFLMKNHKNT